MLFKIEQIVDRSRDGLLKAGVDRTIGETPWHFCQAEGKKSCVTHCGDGDVSNT